MSKLNPTDIQGFTLRGYNMPFAQYLFLHFTDAGRARALIGKLLGKITTGQRWDAAQKPLNTLNIAFTHRGLVALELPLATLLSFPVEFQQGMKARAQLLGDTGANAPDSWDDLWRGDAVHVWLAINGLTMTAVDALQREVLELLERTGGARLLGSQDASVIFENGVATT